MYLVCNLTQGTNKKTILWCSNFRVRKWCISSFNPSDTGIF